MRGKHLCFEGVDYSGKTTLSRKIVNWLNEEMSVKAIYAANPGATPIGQQLRSILKSQIEVHPFTQSLLFIADWAEFINTVLEPNLEQGIWVITDRNNFVSGLVYQIADGCDLEQLDKVQSIIENPPKVDLMFVLKVTYEQLKERSQRRGIPDRWDDRGQEWFDRISDAYDNLLENHHKRLASFIEFTTDLKAGDDRINVPRTLYLHANKTEDQMFNEAKKAIEPMIKEKAHV